MLIMLTRANSTVWLGLTDTRKTPLEMYGEGFISSLNCGPHANVGNRLEKFNVFTFVIAKNSYENTMPVEVC